MSIYLLSASVVSASGNRVFSVRFGLLLAGMGIPSNKIEKSCCWFCVGYDGFVFILSKLNPCLPKSAKTCLCTTFGFRVSPIIGEYRAANVLYVVVLGDTGGYGP